MNDHTFDTTITHRDSYTNLRSVPIRNVSSATTSIYNLVETIPSNENELELNTERGNQSRALAGATSHLNSQMCSDSKQVEQSRKSFSQSLEQPSSTCNLCSKVVLCSSLARCSFPSCSNFVCWPRCSDGCSKIFFLPNFDNNLPGNDQNIPPQSHYPQTKKSFICHSHFCMQCFESNWRHYSWDKSWREKVKLNSEGIHGILWNDLVYSCKNMTERKHFEKGKSPLKKPRFPKLFVSPPGSEYEICTICKAASCHQCSHPLSAKIDKYKGRSICYRCILNELNQNYLKKNDPVIHFPAASNNLALKELEKAILKESNKSRRTFKFAKFERIPIESSPYIINHESLNWQLEPFQFIKSNYCSPKNKFLMKFDLPTNPCECKGKCDVDCPNRSNGIQCFPKICSLGEIDCGNRLIPKFVNTDHLRTIEFAGKGKGVISEKNFSPGELVCEYVGEVISSEEYQQRTKKRSMQEIDDKVQRHWYVMEVKNGVYIDSTYMGNLARFINHSCDPNCQIGIFNVKGTYRMGILCRRKIKKGEEITYAYGFKSKGIGKGFSCLCGSPNCVGQVGIGNSIHKLYGEVQRHHKMRATGNMSEWLQNLTAHLTDNEYSNPYRLRRPIPASILDGLVDMSEFLKRKKLKFDQIEELDPLFAGIKQKKHLFLAHLNYIRLLHLNGGTLEDYYNSITKKFAMDIPWALLANELSWPQRDAVLFTLRAV